MTNVKKYEGCKMCINTSKIEQLVLKANICHVGTMDVSEFIENFVILPNSFNTKYLDKETIPELPTAIGIASIYYGTDSNVLEKIDKDYGSVLHYKSLFLYCMYLDDSSKEKKGLVEIFKIRNFEELSVKEINSIVENSTIITELKNRNIVKNMNISNQK